jgi:hypothetical protein
MREQISVEHRIRGIIEFYVISLSSVPSYFSVQCDVYDTSYSCEYCDVLWTDDLVNFNLLGINLFSILYNLIVLQCHVFFWDVIEIGYSAKVNNKRPFSFSCKDHVTSWVASHTSSLRLIKLILGHGVRPHCLYKDPLWLLFLLSLLTSLHHPLTSESHQFFFSLFSPFNGLDYFTLLVTSVSCLGLLSRPSLLYQCHVLQILAYSSTLRIG